MNYTFLQMGVIHDPVGIFALILVAFLIASWLSETMRLHRPALMIALGTIAGQKVIGIAEAGAALQVLSSIGTIYIFFMSGLSVSGLSRIAGFGSLRAGIPRRSALRFISWSLAPALIGMASGFALGEPLLGALAIGTLFASAGAAASFSESVPLYPDIAAYGPPAGASILIVLCMLLLASVSSGVGIRLIVLNCGFACAFAGVELALLPRIVALVLRRARRPENSRAWLFLAIAFTLAYAGTFLSIPAWFSAFFVGVSLSSAHAASGPSESRARIPGDGIFASAAFFSMGISLDLSGLGSAPDGAVTIGALLVVGLASRALAAAFTRRISSNQGWSMGLALPYTAFSLAAAWVFFELGLFDIPVFLGSVLLALVSGAISTALLKRTPPAAARPRGHGEQDAPRACPNRILVALSNPSSIPQLLDLATLLHGTDNQSPLFPLVVRAPSEPEGIVSATSETLLATAIMRLSDLKKPVLPLNAVSENPARGILDAASGKQCDSIIIGWNARPRLAHAFFSSVIDQVVAESSALVLVSRTQFPWKSTKQLFAILPPGAERLSGFDAAFLCVERLSRASYAPLSCLSEQNSTLAATRSIVQKSLHFASWREIPELLAPVAGSAASIAIISSPAGRPHWNPAYERLPHILAEKLPQANVLVIYMPVPGVSAEQDVGGEIPPTERDIADAAREADRGHARAILLEAVHGGRVKVNTQGSAIAEAVYDLLFSSFPGSEKRDLQILSDRCIDLLRTQPIEIEPGVVLVHERIDSIQYPVVCFSANRAGYRLSALENPTHIVVLILVPTGQRPEDHLRFLADIAALFRNDDLKSRLLSASAPEDIVS